MESNNLRIAARARDMDEVEVAVLVVLAFSAQLARVEIVVAPQEKFCADETEDSILAPAKEGDLVALLGDDNLGRGHLRGIIKIGSEGVQFFRSKSLAWKNHAL